MRRTPSYFKKKLSMLHKMVFIKRLSSLLNSRDHGEPHQPSHSKGYYRYSSLQDLKDKYAQGHSLSCIKLNIGSPDLVWMAFGRAHQVMNIIPASIGNLSQQESCGFTFSNTSCKSINKYSKREQISSNTYPATVSYFHW
eukprot:scaffold42105_cov69-Cyclotella_meneghiniana.AAC.1